MLWWLSAKQPPNVPDELLAPGRQHERDLSSGCYHIHCKKKRLTMSASGIVSLTAPSSSMIGRSFGSKPSASASSALLAAALKSLDVLVMSTSTLRSRSWSDCAANSRSAQHSTPLRSSSQQTHATMTQFGAGISKLCQGLHVACSRSSQHKPP